MAVNLDYDGKLTEIEGITDSATGWGTKINEFLRLAFGSTTNKFGALALLDTAPNGVPPGAFMEYGGLTAPTGWLLCDGASVSRTTYADLFAVLGTRFGSTSGTTFNVPDFRRKIALGAGGTVPAGTNGPAATVGSAGGDEEIVLAANQLPAHSHGAGTLAAESGGAHTHTLRGVEDRSGSPGQGTQKSGLASYSSDDAEDGESGTTASGGAHTHTLAGNTANQGSGLNVPIMPPVLVVTKIVKT